MASEIQGAIDVLVGQIEAKMLEVSEIKRTINGLCRATGSEPMFEDAEMHGGITGRVAIKPDTFYGVGPGQGIRKYLEMRGKSTGAASLDDILDALSRGGFDFKGQGWNDQNRWKNQLSIAISKNLNVFHRLPNTDAIGLADWYPEAAKRAAKAKGQGGKDKEDDDDNGTSNGDKITDASEDQEPASFIPRLTDEDMASAAAGTGTE